MSRLLRYNTTNQVVFITNVTYLRRPILDDNYDLLWNAITTVNTRISFDLIPHVYLPDHFHVLLAPGENSVSDILHRIKLSFGSTYRKRKGLGKGRAWQKRFWDHMIRDQNDLNKHIDYIHYNPVKHGLVRDPVEYRHSSMAQYRAEGYYEPGWACSEAPVLEGEFGDD